MRKHLYKSFLMAIQRHARVMARRHSGEREREGRRPGIRNRPNWTDRAIALAAIAGIILSACIGYYSVKLSREALAETRSMNRALLETTKEHNRLSVRPIITPGWHRTIEPRLSIRNDGIGPAFITDIKVWIDGEEVLASSPLAVLRKAAEKLGVSAFTSRFAVSTLSPGMSANLLELDDGIQGAPYATRLAEALRRIRLVIHFEDIYGTKAISVSSAAGG